MALSAVVAALATTSTARAQDACPNDDLRPARDQLADYERAVECLINQRRAQAGRSPLVRDWRLARVGERYASAMVEYRFFSHITPGGSDLVGRLRRMDYLPRWRFWMAGEVLAWGVFWRSTPRATVQAWWDSPPHREALLNQRFREMGAGATIGNPVRRDEPGVTVAVELGRVG
jgi:uncharacterized protein YkwD